MFDLNSIKPHVPKVEPQSYFWVVGGKYKSGKTSMFYEMAKKYFGGLDKCLLLAFEPGYKVYDGIYAVDIDSWLKLEQVVDALVTGKSSIAKENQKSPFNFIGLDTVDIMYDLAVQQVLKEESERQRKLFRVLNDISYGQGHELVRKKLQGIVNKLRNAGYGIFAITHDKEKQVEQRDGRKFDTRQLSIPGKSREVFLNAADVVMYIDVTRETDDDGNVVQKRYMHLREDGYVEGGSRLPFSKDKIEYDIDHLYELFVEAVQKQIKDKDIKELAEKERQERERQATEFADQEKGREQLIAEIDDIAKSLPSDQAQELGKRFREEIGKANYHSYQDIEQLQHALRIARSFVK